MILYTYFEVCLLHAAYLWHHILKGDILIGLKLKIQQNIVKNRHPPPLPSHTASLLGGNHFIYLFIYLLIYLFIYLFMAVLGLHFCARAFSSCGERGPLFIAVRGPLTVTASPVAEHRLQTRRLSSCGSWAQLLRGMWDLPRPGLEPVSPALAGGLSTTAPPGKPQRKPFLNDSCFSVQYLYFIRMNKIHIYTYPCICIYLYIKCVLCVFFPSR